MSFPIDLFHFYQHALCGTYNEKEDKFSGVHFLDKEAVKIKRYLYINAHYVIKADVWRYNYITEKWILKENTTLFPPFWDETTLLLKLDSAYRFRFPIQGKKNQFGAITDCGVKMLFIYINGKPKTVYPLI
ncbi:MAG: EndoU domain-containing protein [Flavobacterium sp.]|nr:EndoU domain-containing protein [Flavobacterium sp.]